MVHQIIFFLKKQKKNLLEIQPYITRGSINYAEKVVRGIVTKIQTLRSQPEQGMIVVTSDAVLCRRMLYQSCRIIYFYEQPTISIVAIFHQARQIPDHFDNHLFT